MLNGKEFTLSSDTFLLLSEGAFWQLAFLVGHEMRSLCKNQIVNVNDVHGFQCLYEQTRSTAQTD